VTTLEGGDFYEPGASMRSKGLPKKFALEKMCTNEKARSMLWEESEKACGEWKL
jgi:hypothetical protein